MHNAFRFNHISHLTLHNIGFETRKIFLSEKFAQSLLKTRGCLNHDLGDSKITLIKKSGESFYQANHGQTLHNAGFDIWFFFCRITFRRNWKNFEGVCLNHDSPDSSITLIKVTMNKQSVSPLIRGRYRGGLNISPHCWSCDQQPPIHLLVKNTNKVAWFRGYV